LVELVETSVVSLVGTSLVEPPPLVELVETPSFAARNER
jgi:hypothetical protein